MLQIAVLIQENDISNITAIDEEVKKNNTSTTTKNSTLILHIMEVEPTNMHYYREGVYINL